MPAFFVPHVEPEKQEEAYQQLARSVGAGVPQPENRVYSITWTSRGERWTATVGEQLQGTATITKGRGREKREYQAPRSTSDTVLAIFSGVPFMIVHDNRSRHWNLPIYAGNPSAVVKFSE